MKKYVCNVCGWVYDPEVGVPEADIPAGTPFEELPDDFVCPLRTSLFLGLCNNGVVLFYLRSPFHRFLSFKFVSS